MVGGKLLLVPHMGAACFDVGCRDEDLHLGFAHPIEIHQPDDQILQRIEIVRVEIVWARQPRHEIEHHIGGRGVETPSAEHRFDWRALERAGARLFQHAIPETAEAFARFFAIASVIACSQRHGVHGAGGRAGDALDLDAGVFEQAVEHAPRKRAMRATALQREVDEFRGVALGHALVLARLERLSRPRRQ